MQFQKSIAATRSALRAAVILNWAQISPVAGGGSRKWRGSPPPRQRRSRRLKTTQPNDASHEQLPTKTKPNSKRGVFFHVVRSVGCTRLLISLLEIILPDLPELCRLRFVGSRWVSYTIFSTTRRLCCWWCLLLLASARATLLSFFVFLRFWQNALLSGNDRTKDLGICASCPSIIGLFNRISLFLNAAAFCKLN